MIDGGLNPKDSIINTANIIYDKFAERGNIRTDSDLRYLLGLGHTWGNIIPDEFRVTQKQKATRSGVPKQP